MQEKIAFVVTKCDDIEKTEAEKNLDLLQDHAYNVLLRGIDNTRQQLQDLLRWREELRARGTVRSIFDSKLCQIGRAHV